MLGLPKLSRFRIKQDAATGMILGRRFCFGYGANSWFALFFKSARQIIVIVVANQQWALHNLLGLGRSAVIKLMPSGQ